MKDESTQERIARLAGVSQAAVSMAFTGKGSISQETRNRILEVASLLGYRPGPRTGRLRRGTAGRSRLRLAVSMNWNGPGTAPDARFARIFHGIMAEAARHEISMLPWNIGSDSAPVQAGDVDGLVFFTKETFELMQSNLLASVPMVSLLQEFPFIASVVTDEALVVELALRHLLETGHRRIGFLGMEGRSFQRRLRHFEEFHRDNTLLLSQSWLVFTEAKDEMAAGFECFQRLWSQEKKPTALLVHSDFMALGAIKAAVAAGVQVPEDVSIVSVDGLNESAVCAPPLTTVSLFWEKIGSTAVTLLREFVEKSVYRADKIVVPPSLVCRESVRNLLPKSSPKLIIR